MPEIVHACPRCGWQSSMTVDEAAEELGVSGQTIRNWVKSGKLPGAVTEKVYGGFRYLVPVTTVRAAKEGAA